MPEAHVPSRLVFVYGTLRKGQCNDVGRYAPAPVALGQAEIAGTLYDFGPYPGAVLDGAGIIRGEVYRVDAGVEAQLDALEGVQADGKGEYRRRFVPVTVASMGRVECLVYEIRAERVRGAPVIPGGDWVRRHGFGGREG